MAKYLVETTHSAPQCLAALDEIVKYNVGLLDETVFGCMAGDHRGWAIVEAGGESEVLNRIPSTLRGDTRVVPVTPFSREQIEAYHKG